jgi:hypothetical protein
MTGIFISNDGIFSDHLVFWNWNLNCSFLHNQQPPMVNFSEQINSGTTESISVEKDELNVFPNPTSGAINIDVVSFMDESLEVEMFNALGELVWSRNIDKVETALITTDMTNLAAGVYFLQITSKGKRLSKQVVFSK